MNCVNKQISEKGELIGSILKFPNCINTRPFSKKKQFFQKNISPICNLSDDSKTEKIKVAKQEKI